MPDLFDRVWEMDKEQSYARLTITPIITPEGKVYHYNEEIQVRPYPNPKMFGGMWGSGGAKDKKELERVIRGFNQMVERLKAEGLEKVEIEEMPEVTRAEYEARMPSKVEADKRGTLYKQPSLL